MTYEINPAPQTGADSGDDFPPRRPKCFPCFRSGYCTGHQTTSFAAPGDHVKTLYDNFEFSLRNHPQVSQEASLNVPAKAGALW